MRQLLNNGIEDFLLIPGLGPKRIHYLYRELDINALEQLLDAAKAHQLQTLPGFGKRLEETIIHSIESYWLNKQ